MEPSYKSIFEIYEPGLKIGTKLGAFKLNILTLGEENGESANVRKETLWGKIVSWLRFTAQMVFMAQNVMILVMVGVCASSCESVTVDLKIVLTGWVLTAAFALSAVYVAHTKPERLRIVLGRLRAAEARIIRENLDLKLENWSVRESLQWEKRLYTFLALFESLSVLIVCVFVGLNVSVSPRTPGYLYSLAPREREIPWFRVLSLVAQIWFTLCLGVVRCESQLLHIYIVRTFNLCGRIIATTPDELRQQLDQEEDPQGCIPLEPILYPREVTEKFQGALKSYKELREIMGKYNEIFSGALVGFKACSLLLTTSLIYSGMRNGMNTPGIGLLLFHSASFLHCLRVFRILYLMGKFFPVSKSFRQKWGKYLAWNQMLTERNRALLKSCWSFGFQVGNFYIIKSSTALTFYSILMSYIILAFQLH